MERSDDRELLTWFEKQLALRLEEMRRRGRAARDRTIGLAIWFGLSFVLPDPWKYFAWWIAVAMGVAALWNFEQWLIARRQAAVTLEYLDG